jgi:arylsulfatase A-like enzyme
MSNRPNILFVIADQHNARMMGCAGDAAARTPNLDRLAAAGVRFTRAYAPSPICSPSRISLYTGKEISRHGYYGNANHLVDAPCPEFLPTRLREAGYQTALVGRSHMVGRWTHEGFERVRYMNFADSDRYVIEDNAWLQHLIDHGVADHYDISLPCNVTRDGGFTSSMPLAHCEEMWAADEAVRFLQERDRERPFYLHVGYDHPHDPIAPPAAFDRQFAPADVELPANHEDTFEGKPPHLQERARTPGGYPHTPRDKEHLRWLVAKQEALVALVDESVGRILAELDRQGELADTLVVYTADHGDFAGEHGLVLKNLGLYESVHRAPLILHWPGRWRAGAEEEAIVELIDLYPTLLEAAGLTPPPCDGRSLAPLLTGVPDATGRPDAVCDWGPDRALRTDRFRYVEYRDRQTGELYDHRDDPGELQNRWDDPAYAEERAALAARLEERIPYAERTVRTTQADDRTRPGAEGWFAEDSPIFAMWQYGIKWSQLQPYLEPRPAGGLRLTEPAKQLAERFPFRPPAL